MPMQHNIYVAGHGLHTGLVVHTDDVPAGLWPARDDFPKSRFLEVGWGDRAYYTHPDPGLWLALRALLWPTDSAVHAVGVPKTVEGEFPGSELVELRVSEAGFARLLTFVAASHARDAQGYAIVLGPGQREHSSFYASERRFHLFETCNTWVARALHAAGLPISPKGVILAEAVMRQVRRFATGSQARH
jgi:uncharacterized protein (TIGR02117 family)